ncbi:MAG: hypothetical protein ACREXU_10430, partial [Gammaproteobacteria bacterium]
MACSDPLKPPGEERARGGGIAPLGSVLSGSIPPGSIQLQPVFGDPRRRPALGGPLPFVAAAVVLGIVAVLVTGHRGEGPAEPGAIEPSAIEPRAVERRVLEPGGIERDGIDPGAKVPGAIERGVTEPGPIEPGSIDRGAVEPEAEAPSNPPVAAAVAPAAVDTDRPGEEARA